MDKLIIVGKPVKFFARHLSDADEIERFGGGRSLWIELIQKDMAQLILNGLIEAGMIHFEGEDREDGSFMIHATLSVNKLGSVPRETNIC